MKLGKVIRELDVEPDEDLIPVPQQPAPEPTDVPDSAPTEPARVPA